MKKLLILGTIATLANTTLAKDKTGFYLQANIGAIAMNEAKEKNSVLGVSINSNKSKANISPTGTIGAGYYLNNFIRNDITFGYSKIGFAENIVSFNVYDTSDNLNYIGQVTANRKSSIYTIMFNGYVDLPITDNMKFFVGGGVGIARIKESISQNWTANVFNGLTCLGHTTNNDSDKTENENNFTYSLTVGADMKIHPNTTIELAYKWHDFGETKYKDHSATKNRYNGHSLTTGIRFDL